MDTNLTGGAGANLDNLVAGWSNYYVTNVYSSTNPAPADLKVVNQGQLNYIATLVYRPSPRHRSVGVFVAHQPPDQHH